MFFPGASPMETLQTFALYRVQGLIASPGGLSGFLTFYDTNRDFPCGFDIILSAGSPLPDSLSQRVRARMCSNLIFYYGTTETSTVASAPAHALIGASGAVGYVTPDVSVQIVDDSGNPVPANQEGAVRVRTPVSVHGYLDDPAPAQTAFRDGYFDTGDAGAGVDVDLGKSGTACAPGIASCDSFESRPTSSNTLTMGLVGLNYKFGGSRAADWSHTRAYAPPSVPIWTGLYLGVQGGTAHHDAYFNDRELFLLL